MRTILNKTITSLLILMLLLLSCPLILIEVNAAEGEKQVYETLKDYLKENFIVKTDDGWTNNTQIDYDNLNKDEITELYIWSTKPDEDFNLLPLSINNFDELYEFKNLSSLTLENLENLEKIDFTKLTNLTELDISRCTLNGKIDFTNSNKLNSIFISLEGDLSNAVINTEGLWEKEELYNIQINFDTSNTEKFSIVKAIPNMDYYYHTSIEGYKCFFHRSNAMGGGTAVYCDTLENYLKNFYPDNTKDEIVELDLVRDSVQILDFSTINELTNLKKLTIDASMPRYNEETKIGEFTKVDISGLKNLKDFRYVYHSDDDNLIENDPALGKEIISDDYSYIKNERIEHRYTYEDGETDIWYECSYYFNKYITNENIATENFDNTDKITGFSLTNNKISVKEALESNYFSKDIDVKVFDDSDKEIADTTKGLGTGSKVKLYENGKLIQEYTVVIYGDTTGDGTVNAFDALTLIKGINNKVSFKSEAHKEAGRIITGSGKNPTALDALAIVKSANNKYTINQSK